MKKKFFQQQTPSAKNSVRFIQNFPVNVPIEKIDLYKWITEMNDVDYPSYSTAHKAIGSYTRDNRFYMTNVENIGTETLVQKYELKNHAPNSIQLYSPQSRAYILRWFPVTVGVPWELYVQPVSATSSRVICLIGVDYPNFLLRLAAWFIGLGGFFLRNHLKKEGKSFAMDIERKFKG
jgi:hypothetical protein